MKRVDASSLNPNFYRNLGLAQRARKLVFGEVLLKSVKQCRCVVVSADISARSFEKIKKKCQFYDIDLIVNCHHDLMNQAVGKFNAMVIGVLDEQIKNLLMK